MLFRMFRQLLCYYKHFKMINLGNLQHLIEKQFHWNTIEYIFIFPELNILTELFIFMASFPFSLYITFDDHYFVLTHWLFVTETVSTSILFALNTVSLSTHFHKIYLLRMYCSIFINGSTVAGSRRFA